MKILKHIANLGYGSRKEVAAMFREGRITDADGDVLYADDVVTPDVMSRAVVRIDGEPLDPAPGLLLMLHKPAGYTCSTRDAGRVVYDLLPDRFRHRKPLLAPVGRLDRDTTGLLLMTDDGALLHRIISPKTHMPKVYEATLTANLRGDESALFASGALQLESDDTPLAPAILDVLAPRRVRLSVIEGRYHQVRRMFAAVDNHVDTLHRAAIGNLTLDGLASGEWRVVDTLDSMALFASNHRRAS